MTAEPQKNAAEGEPSEDDWEREQEEAEQAMLAERVGLVVGGRYKIVRTLGAGGMGGVYEAEHELIGKKVALKCLHREYTRDRDLVERFKREARAATAIGNEHIVDVTDMGDLPDGAPFLVMEFLAGTTLNGLMEDEGPMRIGRAIHIARQVCDALGAAHEKGIVHRDLKPENVFLTRRGNDPDFVKVLDFGISKIHSGDRKDRGLTRTGMAIGTPSYMSPEQAQGLRDVDARTDVWALGVILFEMLAGRRPFEADSYPMLLMRIVGSEPDALTKWRKDIPDELAAIVMRCLEKPVATRMQTMRDLEAQLARFADLDRPPEVIAEERRGEPGPSQLRSKRSEAPPADGTAATQMVNSTPPPSNESGVRTSAVGGNATRVHGSVDAPESKARAPQPAGEAASGATGTRAPAPAAQTGEIGAVVRRAEGRQRTEIGSVVHEREGSEVPAPPRSNGPLIGIAVAALVVLAVGVGYVISGGSGGSVAPPPTSAPVVTPPPTTVATVQPPPSSAPPTSVVAAPAEVRVRISVVPNDATITIDGVEFPNPMDAMQPRQLTPVRIGVTRDGYRTLERLAIFDSDQNFHFELSRGRGVQHVGVTGDEVPEPGHEHTPPPSTTATHTGDGFREF